MANKIQCDIHGERAATYVCSHLVTNTFGLGFNCDEPTNDEPFPNAWCNDCEIIRSAHGAWNEESEKLTKISLLCSGCYQRTRIRNTCPAVTLNDLKNLRWKCGSCEEWHIGPCLDFGYTAPKYWPREPGPHDFLSDNFCSVNQSHFFARGIIHLPIIGTNETLRWGVWGSLSRENFTKLQETDDDPKRVDLPPMFSWLSSKIAEYPDTLLIKMYTHVQPVGTRPIFELQDTDHPLSQEYHRGITPERVKEIMLKRLPAQN
jgi:hypothetical protein